MAKRNNRIPKTEHADLLVEAKEIGKFNFKNKLGDLLNDIKLSQKQEQLFRMIQENEIVTVTGPAGTSKTFMAIYCGLNFLINNKNNKIFLTKPIVEAGEKLGFLPGDQSEKLDPYVQSYIDLFYEILGKNSTDRLFADQRIIFEPVAYLRGRNISESFIIIDESQNYTEKQLMTLVTRKCASSRVVLLGDILQDDRFNYKDNPFELFKKEILGPIKKNVAHFEFTTKDIVRDKIIIDIIENYQKYIINYGNKKNNGR